MWIFSRIAKKVRIFTYINPISVISNDEYWIYEVKISVISNDGYWIYVVKYSHFFLQMTDIGFM